MILSIFSSFPCRKGHDTCQGDSGGPMAVKENGRFVVIGVTSSGQGCGATGYAGIYTRVSFYHDWIKDNVRDVCTSGTLPSTSPSTTPRTTSTTPSTNSNYIQPTASTTILQGKYFCMKTYFLQNKYF